MKSWEQFYNFTPLYETKDSEEPCRSLWNMLPGENLHQISFSNFSLVITLKKSL
jgi:hypothetical protein